MYNVVTVAKPVLCGFILMMILLPVEARASYCIPVVGGATCATKPCNPATVGATAMDGDKTGIIACLLDSAGSSTSTWKSFTSSELTSSTSWRSSNFYEDTSGSWAGAQCPDDYVMTGIYTTNVGKGGHNYWYIQCKKIGD